MAVTFCVISLCISFVVVHSLGPCDPLVPEYCAVPFPNSFFTRLRKDSNTGVQVNLTEATPPVDVIGRRTEPAQWNTMGERESSVLVYYHTLTAFECLQMAFPLFHRSSPTFLISAISTFLLIGIWLQALLKTLQLSLYMWILVLLLVDRR